MLLRAMMCMPGFHRSTEKPSECDAVHRMKLHSIILTCILINSTFLVLMAASMWAMPVEDSETKIMAEHNFPLSRVIQCIAPDPSYSSVLPKSPGPTQVHQ